MLTNSRCLTWRASLLKRLILTCILIAISSQGSFAARDIIDYVTTSAEHSGVIIDTRSTEQCEAASLARARCLPARDVLGPRNRLANFSGLLWLLGTAGLTGAEHVLVTGDRGENKEFIAGVLYLAGQRKVSVLTSPLKSLPAGEMAPGISRSKTRENVYQAAMRSGRIVLRSDLAGMLQSGNAPVLLDGRSEREYWGQEIRGARGGHLPGAQHLPVITVRPAKNNPPPVHLNEGEYAIAYAHGSYQSIIYLARLLASGVDAKVLLEGWAGWASDGALPADAVTYADQRAARRPAVKDSQTAAKSAPSFITLMVLAGLVLFAAGFLVSRKLFR